ncbi:hypothetical protein RUND412_009158 [Rhizina undulata]
MTRPTFSPQASTPLLARQFSPLPSNAYLYPIYGILYLPFHPPLLRPFLSRVLPLLIISLILLIAIFTFLYLPQVAILAFFKGPLAWANAAVMCLTEASALLQVIAESCLTELQVVETFDAVILQKAEKTGDLDYKARIWDLLSSTRELHHSQPDTLGKLGEHRVSPYQKFSFTLTLQFLVELPLNLIPVVGAPLFLALQAYHLGPLAHYRYCQLLGMSKKERKLFIRQNRWKYWLFGLVHVTLQLVPVLSIFFLFTSATGAALWAFEREERMILHERRRRSLESGPSGVGVTAWRSPPPPPPPENVPATVPPPPTPRRGWRHWMRVRS